MSRFIDAYDRAVESELERDELKLVCAWHPKYFGAEKVMREGAEPASHGICKECRERLLKGRAA